MTAIPIRVGAVAGSEGAGTTSILRPFAALPVADLRCHPPKPAPASGGTLDATD